MEINKRSLILYNPISGRAIDQRILDEYRRILAKNGYDADVLATSYPNHATEAIQNADNYDVVFSIGGDGTLNEVVRGNYFRDKKLPICPLPSGTCNDVASMLGYGKNMIDNLEMALCGEVFDMDIGLINNNPFIYVVGVGKLMNIPYETKGYDKQKTGYLAYLKNAIPEVVSGINLYRTEVNIDGVNLDDEYSLIIVSNSNHIAGINNFHKDVCLDDGKMEVLLCRAKSKVKLVESFLKYFLGKDTEEIIFLKAHDASFKFLDIPEKNWCIDGEKYDYGGSEYIISVGDKIPILTPAGKAKKLFKSRTSQCEHF